jgi:uncharacterized coiled-coil DUF342 family protein
MSPEQIVSLQKAVIDLYQENVQLHMLLEDVFIGEEEYLEEITQLSIENDTLKEQMLELFQQNADLRSKCSG